MHPLKGNKSLRLYRYLTCKYVRHSQLSFIQFPRNYLFFHSNKVWNTVSRNGSLFLTQKYKM